MNIDAILDNKGREVFSIAASAAIADAVAILSDRNIGAVIVKEGAAVVGILSERDIVRHLKRDGADALTQPVRAYMTANPFTCTPDHALDEVLGLMTRRRIRHVPVMRGGELVGMVSIGDVVKRKIEDAVREAEALKEYISS
jgi:CBS domain-containing protein